MGFKVNAYLTIWENEDKGKYSVAKVSTSKKDKNTGVYETDFSAMVRFFGKAHDVVKGLGRKDKVVIDACEVTQKYDKERGKSYTNFTVFECHLPDGAAPTNTQNNAVSNGNDFVTIPDDLDSLPFS